MLLCHYLRRRSFIFPLTRMLKLIRHNPTGLEAFINGIACHPLVQNEKCLHMFLQDDLLMKEQYVPGKIGR